MIEKELSDFRIRYKFCLQLIGMILFCLSHYFYSYAQTPHLVNEKRGIVVYPSDIISVGANQWINFFKKNHLNLLGIRTDTKFETLEKLESFLKSNEGLTLLKACKENNIDIEFELHVLKNILPRHLFQEHPEYFREDKNGERQQEFNMCFSSEAAYNEIEKNIIEITKWLKPTTNRYFFWTDNVSNTFCNCQHCKKYSNSEQALLYENKLQSILKKINPTAQVAHLAYHQTLSPPVNVKPDKGVFLEYAPISRDYSKALSQQHKDNLERNLKVFPIETAHILEYWLDVSMFSNWEKGYLNKLDLAKNMLERDISYYKSIGVQSITSFGAWINRDYINLYGISQVNNMLRDYDETLIDTEIVFIDGNLDDWETTNGIEGLFDPWEMKNKDKTIFDYKITDNYFNFYFITEDSTYTVSPYIGEQSIAEGDRVELFFSPTKNIYKYYCVEISPEGNVLDYSAEYYRKFNNDWDFETLTISTKCDDNKCIYEGNISMKEINILGFRDKLYLGIFRADYQGREKVNWYTNEIPDSKKPDFHIPSAFGKILLKK